MIGKPRGAAGRYPVFVYDGSKKSGKRYVGQAATLEEARKLELHGKLDTLNRKPTPERAWTVDVFAEHWLEEMHGPGTKRPETSTQDHNRQSVKHFRQAHGHKPITLIDRETALAMARDKPQQAKAVAAMFADALDLERIEKNPFARLGIRPNPGRANITPLNLDEVNKLAEIAGRQGMGGPEYSAYVIVAAWTGLRPGEMCGLHTDNVDWRTREIRVPAVQATRRVNGELGPPKGKAGRFVPLSEEAFQALTALNRRSGYMFRSATGKPLRPSSLRFWWTPTRSAFLQSLPADHWLPRRLLVDPTDHLVPYELRHYFGSMLSNRGMSAKDISVLMGNTEAVASRTYLHVYEDDLRNRARAAFGNNVRELRPEEERTA